MDTIVSKKALTSFVNESKAEGKTIGLVPTMGALHEGHLSLVRSAKQSTDVVIVSIFVNPTQFNNPQDLETYPRTLETDCALLKEAGVNVVFTPEIKEMYPAEDTRVFDFGDLDRVMEGAFRPGHFNGVAQIVSKLFDAVNPDKAFFGDKDFQQLAIIQRMVKDYGYDVEVVPCAIVREEDGLAMSSRNQRLTPEHREAAPEIYKALQSSLKQKSKFSVEEAKQFVINEVNNNPLLEVEYFDIVNGSTLKPISNWDECDTIFGCIAVFAGDIRLIDNIRY